MDGIIKYANNGRRSYTLAEVKEAVEFYMLDQFRFLNEKYLTVEEVAKIPELRYYRDNVGVYNGKIVFLGDEESEEGKLAKDLGYDVKNMTKDEFRYYIELGILADKVSNVKQNIGRELMARGGLEQSITIGSIIYDNGWYLIGNYTDDEKSNNTYSSQFEELGIEDTTHAPYLVNYETGEVLSIDGMPMYASQNKVHSFNLKEGTNTTLDKSILYVNSMTERDENHYGNLNSSGGKFKYSDDGALLFDSGGAIAYCEVDKKYTIDHAYSISTTIECDISQKSGEFPGMVFAISEKVGSYICWLGIYNGYMNICSYSTTSWSGRAYESEADGFLSTSIAEYNNKPMNIQVVGTEGGETKLYINGTLKKTFKSGDLTNPTFKNVTIGDLRIGRNLKLSGKLYDFAIYGKALTEQEVQDNWNFFKK